MTAEAARSSGKGLALASRACFAACVSGKLTGLTICIIYATHSPHVREGSHMQFSEKAYSEEEPSANLVGPGTVTPQVDADIVSNGIRLPCAPLDS